VPGELTERVARLFQFTSWDIGGSEEDHDDITAAMLASAGGRPVLFVPRGASVPTRLARILVPHDGTPATSVALDAVEDLAGGSHAEIVVLHVLGTELPVETGTLQGPRMVDHDGDDWHEWREEFGRRFPHRSTNMLLGLQIAVGHRSDMILRTAYRMPADLVVIAWGGVLTGRALTLRSVCGAAPCPVLLVAAATPGRSPLAAGGNRSSYRL
jgi:nucleotide-binding universal stress UspA family protein